MTGNREWELYLDKFKENESAITSHGIYFPSVDHPTYDQEGAELDGRFPMQVLGVRTVSAVLKVNQHYLDPTMEDFDNTADIGLKGPRKLMQFIPVQDEHIGQR